MIDLNNVDDIRYYDKFNQLGIMNEWPNFCKEFYNMQNALFIPERIILEKTTISYTQPENILVAGMGGSAIAGDYLKALLFSKSRVPIIVNRSYELPSYVNEKTLVICISYSGNTEETLSMLYHALKKGSMTITISSSGYVEQISKTKGLPYIKIKEGLMPRASLPLIYMALFAILEKFELIEKIKTEINETIKTLFSLKLQYTADNEITNNFAKKLALQLCDTYPVFVGHGLYSPVAYRGKCQFNENSKVLALAEELPEQNHNSIVAFDHKNSAHLRKTAFILLRDIEIENESIQLRFEQLRELAKRKSKVYELFPSGKSLLSKQLSITYLIDYTSIYLGILYGLDPSETSSIAKLKKYLETKNPIKDKIVQKILEL